MFLLSIIQDAVRMKSQPSYQKYSETSIEVVGVFMVAFSRLTFTELNNRVFIHFILANFVGALLHFTWTTAD